jgi:hypothetical protein
MVNFSASATTAFSAPLQRLLGPTALTAVLACVGAPFLASALPFFIVSKRMVRVEPGESAATYWAKYATMHVFYAGFLMLGAFVVLLPAIGPQFTGFHALALYLPSYTIAFHDRSQQYDWIRTIIMRCFFDAPLVAAGYVSRELFGAHLFAPFASILDDAIVQGSLPFPSDVAVLAAEPYNVGAVVNMCREWSGATSEMSKHGVVQCWLPHQDTTAPSYKSVVEGCAFIKEFRRAHPKKRVYIHCKGGIARASTMTLGHYILNEGLDPTATVAVMKSKRHIVMEEVKDYPAIKRLSKENSKFPR